VSKVKQRYKVTLRRPSFLDTALKIDGVLDVLECVKMEPINYTRLIKTSKISHKQSFLKYLRYTLENKFVEKYGMSVKKLDGRWKSTLNPRGYYRFYKITDLGRTWMEMTTKTA